MTHGVGRMTGQRWKQWYGRLKGRPLPIRFVGDVGNAGKAGRAFKLRLKLDLTALRGSDAFEALVISRLLS